MSGRAIGLSCMLLAYLDDNLILSENDNVIQTSSSIFPSPGLSSGLASDFTIFKTASLEHVRQHGCRILGSVVGPRGTYTSMIDSKATDLDRSADLITQLPSQYFLLLVHVCRLQPPPSPPHVRPRTLGRGVEQSGPNHDLNTLEDSLG